MNKHIEDLKKIKTPTWSRLLGNWRGWQAARAARKAKHYITTITFWLKRDDEQPRSAFVHLYETGKGERTFSYYKGNSFLNIEDWTHYHRLIIPWAHHKISNQRMLEMSERSLHVPKEWTK